MNSLIGSLAYLKATWSEDSNHLDHFIPFIATLISQKRYKSIDSTNLIQDFTREFGFKVPYHPMMAILQRAKESGVIKKTASGKFVPVESRVIELDFSSESKKHQIKQNEVIGKLQLFAATNYKVTLSKDEAEVSLLVLLGSNDNELLKYEGGPFAVDIKESQKYIVAKFIEHIYANDHDLFKFLTDYEVGLMLSNSLLHLDLIRYKHLTPGLCCYLDTRFLLRLLGIEGIDRKEFYEEFIATLSKEGALLHLFNHTYDELIGILTESEKWVGERGYDPTRSSLATRYFIENNYSKSDIALFKVRVKTILDEFKIIRTEAPNYEENDHLLPINEAILYQKIVQLYSERGSDFNEEEKKYTILRDVKSILSTIKLRANHFPDSIENAKHIFVTTNSALAFISKILYSDAYSKGFVIPPCITDTFLGTLIWVNSPSKVSVIYEKKIIADCYAALQPNPILLKKFNIELDNLKTIGKLTSDEYFMMKSHKVALALLQEKTLGDPENFTDQTPEEIYHAIQEQIRNEEREKLNLEQINHVKTINKLSTAESTLNTITDKATKIATKVSQAITALIFFAALALFVLGLYSSLDSEFLASNKPLRYSLLFLYAIITSAALYYGFYVKKLQIIFASFLKDRLIKLML